MIGSLVTRIHAVKKGAKILNGIELDFYRTTPLAWETARAIHKALSENVTESFANFYNSGAEMVDGAPLLPFDPPLLWDVDTSLSAFVLTGLRSPLMRAFWEALSALCVLFAGFPQAAG